MASRFDALKIGTALTCLTFVNLDVAASQPFGPAENRPVMLDHIPMSVLNQMADATKSIGFKSAAWPIPVVKVAFNGGDPELYKLIEQTASEWTANGGRLSFSFHKPDGSWRTWKTTDATSAAEIRIGFFTDPGRNGYWSAIGTLAKRTAPSEPTMNFGDLGTTLSDYYGGAKHAEWLASYSHEVILHEFGHALSLNHEHFHPQCQSDLKLADAVSWLEGPPNGWSQQQAMFNMDAKTYFDTMTAQFGSLPVSMSPNIDQASVMLYSFEDKFYKSGANSPCRPSGPQHYATTLSPDDKKYYSSIYQ